MSIKRTRRDQPSNVRFTQPYLLLVEGVDDEAFAAVQLEKRSDHNMWQIHNMRGVDSPWRAALEVIFDDDFFGSEGRALGLVIDADTNFAAALQKCRGLLESVELPGLTANQMILAKDSFRAGAFIMPGEEQTGALEDLLLRAATSERRDAAEKFIGELEQNGLGPFLKRPKTLVQAYLAAQTELTKTIPVGVKREATFPSDSLEFEPFRSFLDGLVN